jgi:hypothetical protein
MLFHRDKIGETCLFALDESKRMLAVYSSARVHLSFRPSPAPSCKGKETAHNSLIDRHSEVWSGSSEAAYDNIFERAAAEDGDVRH